MKKKQYPIKWLAFLVLLGSLASFGAQAQEKQTPLAPAKPIKAKVKILKEIDGQHYVLDTTLDIKSSQTVEEAMKNLKLDSTAFRKMDIKAITASAYSKIRKPNGLTFSIAHTQDSARSVLLKIPQTDSLLANLQGIHVIGNKTFGIDKANELLSSVTGDVLVLRGNAKADSLRLRSRIIWTDSALTLSADTIFLRDIVRVKTEGDSGAVKVIRFLRSSQEGEAPSVYELQRLSQRKGTHIIIVNPSVIIKEETKEATAKAGKNSKKGEPNKETNLELELYPNPTSGRLKLSFTVQNKSKAKLRVVDSQGKKVYQEDLGTVQGAFSKELDLSRYGRGAYVVQVQVGNWSKSGKVIVE
ncbi:T9SS C-terminal target domain-containing protein [Rufibacter immobilis]|uniref:T9SS C-terminal target domain-containing protein n=1 Tax=Rufibacter immobilis TaxID=1348778 RepID=A0A3M9MR32_9BACT|nr:T9SS type A sorting domain-containing protein [Rufibacter immobilis]RNI27976.1 T9SS C-terminal target domain-containing protein [Rufibacter immobilis]